MVITELLLSLSCMHVGVCCGSQHERGEVACGG